MNLKEPKCEVIKVLPDQPTKVLISAKHGGGYPSPYQTQDGQIEIVAKVKGGRGTVFFEVIDPDDPSPYLEDKVPDTPWPQIEDLVKDDNDNDNRDTDKNGRLAYDTFQNNCLNPRQVVIGDPHHSIRLPDGTWEVWTTLMITNRFAGDNYRVRATCEEPELGKYFHEQPKLQGKYKESGLLTAWKRVYYERDIMYRVGSLLAQDATAGQNQVVVQNAALFSVNDRVRVFDSVNREENLLTITAINGNTLTLSGNLTHEYLVANQGFVGRETGNEALDFFVPDTNALRQTFDDCYVEFMFLPNGSTGVPNIVLRLSFDRIIFRNLWFNNQGNSNYIYLVGASYNFLRDLGVTWPANNMNFSYIYVGEIENLYPQQTWSAINRNTTNHEMVHQFQIQGREPGEHDHERAWDNSDQCLMDIEHCNEFDDLIELGLSTQVDQVGTAPTFHIYKVRDFPDDL